MCVFSSAAVVRLDGSVPVRYGLRLNMDARYSAVKQQLQQMSGVHETSILICELADPLVKVREGPRPKLCVKWGAHWAQT